ncbi:hypothetical protein AG4045_030742 [Apium graveolens]|uniref:Uncharacterized protein n=1 Tax=Apium graveolens TaxID=4045 RepID=A0A6L5B766_APIGR|nr:hypothetical protein AG4045_030742 [Apium graveolens]
MTDHVIIFVFHRQKLDFLGTVVNFAMEAEKKESGAAEKSKTTSDVNEQDEAFKKCMQENKGDSSKCKPKIEAFESSLPFKPLFPLMLKSGSLTDV